MDDTISRQAAIDALGERPMVWNGNDYELGARNQYDSDVLALETVLSAQHYTDKDIQKIQDIEQAQLDKAYEMGKADALRWIPCSERMPFDAGYYLTTTTYNEVFCDYWNLNEWNRTEQVIAWMLLPEPYKGGDK